MLAKFFRLIALMFLLFLLLMVASANNRLNAAADKTTGYTAKGAKLDNDTFDAKGQNDTLLHISRVGRYSIQVKSDQGTRVEFVDRMGGPTHTNGSPGKKDGRIDLFLDKGTYKIRLFSHENGEGKATLKVMPFQNVNPVVRVEDLPFVPHLKLVSGQLGDLQQHGFWIHIKRKKILRLEMIGRNLSSALLWRDGSWLEDIKPTISVFEPEPGRPMTYIEFHHELNPGLYLLQCYGGPERPWAKDIDKNSNYAFGRNPFHLREGIRYLGRDGQHLMKVSPFGRDTFELYKSTNFVQLVRQDKKDTVLSIYRWSKDRARQSHIHQSKTINKKSRDPWCYINYHNNYNKPSWITVTAKPGDNVELDFFYRQYHTGITAKSKDKRYFVSSIHSAQGRDSIDVTAILAKDSGRKPLKHNVININPNEPYIRRVNLLKPFNVYLFFEEGGTYLIDEDTKSGALGEYQFKPFLLYYPRKFKAPNFRRAGSEFEITPGFYVLTIKPRSKGILHFGLHKKSAFLQSRVLARFRMTADALEKDRDQINLGIAWPEVLIPGHPGRNKPTYYFWLNQRDGADSGIIVRDLPVDLTAPLPVLLQPGESIVIKTKHDKKMKLNVTGGKYNLSIDKIPWDGKTTLGSGFHYISLKNNDKTLRLYNLAVKPAYVPPIPAPVIKPIDEIFPIMTETKPMFLDFDRGERKEFLLRVKTPGLYRLETTGRMATRITVRTRTVISMFSGDQNGIGRNALVQEYLKPGDYLVNVFTKGQSTGRAGIFLHQTPLLKEKNLLPGRIKRRHVEKDAALRYRFTIPESGDYRLHTFSLGKNLAYRLEDIDGWPLVIPNQRGEVKRFFQTGDYFYYTMPAPVEGRRITFLDKIVVKPRISGKGPHDMTLRDTKQNTWMEDENRTPDIYRVSLPAPLNARIISTKKMKFRVIDRNTKKTIIEAKHQWSGHLPPGELDIEVKSIEKNNRLPYVISFFTDALVPGMTQTLNKLPGILTVSLGQAGLVDITSFGDADVKAQLYDSKGNLIAFADDMPHDWNFRISRSLPAGNYGLRVDPSVPSDTWVEVRMQKRRDVAMKPQNLPFTVKYSLKGEVVRIPFRTGTTNSLVKIGTRSSGNVALALFKGETLLAESNNRLFIPLLANQEYILLAWNQGESAINMTLNASTLNASPVNLGTSGQSLTLNRGIQISNPTDHSFYIKPQSRGKTVYYSPLPERPCLPVDSKRVENTANGTGWLVASGKSAPVRLQPVTIKVNTSSSLGVMLNELPFSFTIDGKTDAPILLTVKSINTVTGASVLPASSTAGEKYRRAGMLAAPSLTMAGIPNGGKYRAHTWLTGTTPKAVSQKHRLNAGERLSVDLRAFPKQAPLDFTSIPSIEAPVEPGKSVQLNLPGQPLRLDMILADGLVAFSWSKNAPADIIAASGSNRLIPLTVNDSKLYILNTGDQPARFRAEKRGTPVKGSYAIDPAKPYLQIAPGPGNLEFQLPQLPDGSFLYVAGSDITSRAWGIDGKIYHGTKADINSSFNIRKFNVSRGFLEIKHGPGLVYIWIGKTAASFTGNMAAIQPAPFEQGTGQLAASPQIWKFSLDKPSYISLDTRTATAIALVREENTENNKQNNNKILRLSAGPFETGSATAVHQLDYYLPAGNYRVWSRVLPGSRAPGSLSLKKILPIQLDETEKIERQLIRPGEIQVFRFTVYDNPRNSNIGIGLQTESDNLDARLFDESSHIVANGPLMVKSLKPGTYLMVVRAKGIPVQYRPVLLGNRGSRTGVPNDVIKKYKK